jgi:aspartate/methionine/tyrosine aminotransferase
MNFSRRLPAVLDDNPLALAVAARRAAGQPVLDLTQVNPTKVGLPYPFVEIAAALERGAQAAYEPESRGLLSAREAVAGTYRGRGPDLVDPARLCLTASTSEAYGLLFKLLGDAGAEVLAPRPSYPLIEHMAALEGWRTKYYPLRFEAGGWQMDFKALAAAITPATRAIVVVHPHNPTGWLVRSPDAHFLLETCGERGLALIADEVFLDYAREESGKIAQSFAAHQVSALTFTLGGLSKSCGMPQLKLGWIHVGGPEALAREAQERLDFIADAYLSVGTPVQAALPQLLQTGTKIRVLIQERIAGNFAMLAGLNWPEGFAVLPYAAGWSALIRRPCVPDEEALPVKILERAGVLAHPGYFFDFDADGPGYHIVSLLPEPGEFRAGATTLCEWLPKLV